MKQNTDANQKALSPSFLIRCHFKGKDSKEAFVVATFSLSWFGIKFKLMPVGFPLNSVEPQEGMPLLSNFWTKIVVIYK